MIRRVLNLIAGGRPPRSLATQIYYFLSYDDPNGVFHMVWNRQLLPRSYLSSKLIDIVTEQIRRMYTLIRQLSLSSSDSPQTYHVLHQGRAEYTLITPGNPPIIEKKVMGTNVKAGEQRQLFVGTGVWKMSRIPPADLNAATTEDEKNHTGCLITEVVTPGFHWEDHQFLTLNGLEDLFKSVEGGEEKIKEIIPFLKKTA